MRVGVLDLDALLGTVRHYPWIKHANAFQSDLGPRQLTCQCRAFDPEVDRRDAIPMWILVTCRGYVIDGFMIDSCLIVGSRGKWDGAR